MDAVTEFVSTMKEVHNDGLRKKHFARYKNGHVQETMPVTPFVYEFFIYNTLYSVDWPRSLSEHEVKLHRNLRETEKQNRLEEYLKDLTKKHPKYLVEGFEGLRDVELTGNWTNITPDTKFKSAARGKKFFAELIELRDILERKSEEPGLDIEAAFARIATCRWFVYQIRNNVFHGEKTLGEIWEPKQKRRIEVYYRFLRCLVSSFFLLTDAQLRLFAENGIREVGRN